MERFRSILSVPGHVLEKVRGARKWGADLIAFDLEDSVPERHKHTALANVRVCITTGDAVRVNEPGTPQYLRDRDALRGLAGVVNVPKVIPGSVSRVREELRPLEVAAVIESPLAVLQLAAIMEEGPDALIFGRADFMAAAGVIDEESPLVRHAWLQVAMAAAAYGIPAIDSPCVSSSRLALRREVRAGRVAGYAGKICVHPRQIAPIRAGFSLSSRERRRGKALLEAAKGADGIFEVSGRLVALPMLKLWRRVLAW